MFKKLFTALGLTILIGCQSNQSKNFSDSTEPLPTLKCQEYKIATRVVIVDPSDLETFYANINSLGYYYPKFKFITSSTDVQACFTMSDCLQDSTNNPNTLNIYKLGPNKSLAGWSDFPWNGSSKIMIFGNQSLDVLGHEVGHALGLYHPFNEDGDFVDDTIDVLVRDDPNLMSYSNIPWYLKFLTPGQMDRAEFMLNTLKKNWIIE